MARDKTELTDLTPAAATATGGANEWGIPDWRDPLAYGDVKGWTFKRWRWEFFRRRDDLRAYFDARAQATYERNLAFFASTPQAFPYGRPLRPCEPGFCVPVNVEDMVNIGYSPLPNPRIGEQPSLAIFPHRTDETVRPIDPTLQRNTFGDALRVAGVALSKRQERILGDLLAAQPARLNENEIAMVFDFNLPLAAQLNAAGEWLAMEYRERGKSSQKRRHNTKWHGYLRTLDARETMNKPNWRKLTKALFEQRLLDRHRIPFGGYCDPPPQAGRDMWEAAAALRFNF